MQAQFRYEKLGYVALNVTNLDKSVHFYQELMGLCLVKRDDNVAYFRCSRDHHNLILTLAATPGIKRAAYKLATPEALEQAYRFFDAQQLNPVWISPAECQELHQGPTFRVREPHSGLLLECYHHMLSTALPYQPTVTKIERIGHVVIGTKNYADSVNTLSSLFNFAVSDFVENKFSWMRCFPNPLHHTLAVGNSAADHLHHINFMVTDMDDIGAAINRLKKAGVQIVFGPGRHLPSTSIFLYFLDPDNMTMEFSFGMEELHEGSARLPRMLEMHPNTMDIWGSSPHELFGKVGAIEVEND